MKQHSLLFTIIALAAATSCQDLIGGGSKGTLLITFPKDISVETKASNGIPDPGTFILTVTDSKGKTIYSGSYSASPEHLEVPSGSYTVAVRSTDFDEPLFDTPQWGDTQVVSVTIPVTLQKGNNIIAIANPSAYAPDIDCITLTKK